MEDADRWQTVLIDSDGGYGLLGVVEGRAAGPVAAWLADQPAAWRARVRAVTLDLSTVYKSAARAAFPDALLAADPFHVAQLANRAVGDVRRRVTQQLRGRRGRAGDPGYQIKRLLVRGPATLSPEARKKILTTLADVGGDAGFALGAAWRAKNLLLDLLALSPASRSSTRSSTACPTQPPKRSTA
ncbi:transposase [Frankia sp. QA3]|uniref:transposase n=1 Tax=Frankia sp. QA3 TaxID=710111 RepID=UPI000319C134|nr:transposase [Frankia sp. QA3]